MFMRSFLVLFSIVLMLSSCGSTSEIPRSTSAENNISYLALGDSYTIGESVAEQERWSVQLSQKL